MSGERPHSAAAELRRARVTIVVGLTVWLVLAVVEQLVWGELTSFVLIGWGGSMLVSLVFVVTPLLRASAQAPNDRSLTFGERPIAA